MKKSFCFLIAILLILVSATPAYADGSPALSINKNDISHEVSPTLYGISLDDVSSARDGGLVAEMINNGSFENSEAPLNSWLSDNLEAALAKDEPISGNDKAYEVIRIDGTGTLENVGNTEIFEDGSFDVDDGKSFEPSMYFRDGESYEFSCYIKNVDFDGTIGVYLNSKTNKNNIIQMSTNGVGTNEWTRVSVTLHSKGDEYGSLVVLFDGTGTLKFDCASLVPQSSYGYGKETWKYVSLRSDMVNAVKNLSPSFVRFSCGEFSSWKTSIGALSQRSQAYNSAYNGVNSGCLYNTNALGVHECLQLCEDINAAAVPVVSAGITGQNNYRDYMAAYQKISMNEEEWQSYLVNELGFDEKDDAIEEYTAKIDSLGIKSKSDYNKAINKIILRPGTADFDNYVQDILDFIEYANAESTTSYWGAIRAANGHETPFGIKYLAIGDKNWGDVYFRNFDAIYKAVHKAYPKLTIITCTGDSAEGTDFDNAWSEISQNYRKQLADEHFSAGNSWFIANTDRYDSYDRDSASVMIGGCSAYSEDSGRLEAATNMCSSVATGAFMTGVERNSDLVLMYAFEPMFSRKNASLSETSLVWYNEEKLALSTDYYTQLIFANNIGEKYVDASFTAGEDIYQSVTVDEGKETLYVKLVNNGGKETVSVTLDGFDVTAASIISISHKYDTAYNDLEKQRVAPSEDEVDVKNNTMRVSLDSNSMSVVRISYGNNNGDGFYHLPDTIDTATSSYVPSKSVWTVVILSVCLLGGMVAGYMIYSKFLSKRKKEQRD